MSEFNEEEDLFKKDPNAIQTPITGTEDEDPSLIKKDQEGGEDDENKDKLIDPPEGEEKKKEEIPPKDPTPPAPPVDYKGKFSESARRNQIVEGKNAELENVIADITKKEIPTDEEMKEINPDWEYLSAYEKNQAIKLEVLVRKDARRELENISQKKAEENQQKLENYIFNEPKLKGKEEEFATFALAKKNRGAPMEVLLNAFLFEVKEETPVPLPPAPEEKAPKLNRSTPTGGNPPPKNDKELSDDEIKHIRTTDHKRYNALVRAGKI